MGWCSGTYIFDDVMDEILDVPKINKKRLIKKLITSLQNQDWDCIDDSEYYMHPDVMEAFEELQEEEN